MEAFRISNVHELLVFQFYYGKNTFFFNIWYILGSVTFLLNKIYSKVPISSILIECIQSIYFRVHILHLQVFNLLHLQMYIDTLEKYTYLPKLLIFSLVYSSLIQFHSDTFSIQYE